MALWMWPGSARNASSSPAMKPDRPRTGRQRRQLLGIPGEIRRALLRDRQLLPRLAVERLALTFADRGVQVLEPLV